MTPTIEETSAGRVPRPIKRLALLPLSIKRRLNMKLPTTSLLTAATVCAALATGSTNAAVLVDHTFDGSANDIGGLTFQEVSNGLGSGGSSDLSTGVITAGIVPGNDTSSYGFNATSSIDVTTAAPSANGFKIRFTVSATDVDVSDLDNNGLFFGVVSGTGANGTTGTSLWNNDPHAFGYVAGSNAYGDNVMRQDGANAGTSVTTPLGGVAPTNASFQDGFTITLSLFDDDTWTITSTGLLATDLNGSGSLTTTGTGIFDYDAIAADLTPYVGIQGESGGKITVDRITVTAIPEPGSLALLGLGGLLIARRRHD